MDATETQKLEERFQREIRSHDITQCPRCETPLTLQCLHHITAGQTEAGTEYGLIYIECWQCFHRVTEVETWASPINIEYALDELEGENWSVDT